MWIFVTRMAPPIAFTIPFFLAYTYIGLIDTVAGLALIYVTFNLALVIWTMKGFFDAVPRSLEEAAWIDGAGRLHPGDAAARRAWARGKPPSFAFILSWNDFFFALIPDAHRGHDGAGRDRQIHAICRVRVGQDRRRRRLGDADGAGLHRAGAPVPG